jgi:hypothetical protein
MIRSRDDGVTTEPTMWPTAIGTKPVPPLLIELLTFLEANEDVIGYCELVLEEVTPYWSDENADRLAEVAFSFLKTPNDSYLTMLEGGGSFRVVYLGSEGDAMTVGDSLEDCLWSWADDGPIAGDLPEDAEPRAKLAAWLRERGVINAPPAPDPFDFAAWLDGGTGFEQVPFTESIRTPTPLAATLPVELREIADAVGRRMDDPALTAWLLAQLGKQPRISWKLPVASRHTTLTFISIILNTKYPELFKTKNSRINYASQADIGRDCGYDVLGVPWSATVADVEAILGPPSHKLADGWVDPPTIPVWVRVLDDSADVELAIKHDGTELTVCVRVQSDDSMNSVPDPVLGVFVAWACAQDLLDPAAFTAHTELFERVRTRSAQASELIAAAMPRGFWMSFLVDRPGVRALTRAWFSAFWDHNVVKDLIAVFGERTDEGHGGEPDIATDTWDVVDRATPMIASRFAAVLI